MCRSNFGRIEMEPEITLSTHHRGSMQLRRWLVDNELLLFYKRYLRNQLKSGNPARANRASLLHKYFLMTAPTEKEFYFLIDTAFLSLGEENIDFRI
jgi:hypothetical protein